MDKAVDNAKKLDVIADINSFIKFADESMPNRTVPFKKFYPPKTMKEFKDHDNKQLVRIYKIIHRLIFIEHSIYDSRVPADW